MTADRRGGTVLVRRVLVAGTGLGVLQAVAVHAQDAASSPNQAREEVYIFGQRDAYKTDTSSLGKLVTPIIDTPQSIDTISQQVLQDRGVTDFNQALKTVPGITLGAGEFKSLGNSPTIRGFVARDDMFLDGVDRLRCVDDRRDELPQTRRIGLVCIALAEDVDLLPGLIRARSRILRVHGNRLQHSQARPRNENSPQQHIAAAPVRSHSTAPTHYIHSYIA